MPIKTKPDWATSGGWTISRVEKLKELHARGLSMAQIAKALGSGISRSAVIGKSSRIGLSFNDPAISRPAKEKANVKKRKPERLSEVSRHVARCDADAPNSRPLPGEPPPMGPPCDLVARGFSCQWIHGYPNTGAPWQCCGHPVQAGENYCVYHFDRSLNPAASAAFRERLGIVA